MPELGLLRRRRSGNRSLSRSLLRLLMLFAWVGAGAGVDAGGGERGVLLGIRGGFADGAGVLAGWGAAGRHHCDWEGVGCDAGSRVVEVNVTGGFAGLDCWGCGGVGFFAGAGRGCGGGGVGVLGGKLSPLVAELRGLRVLSLPFNGIEGEIPAGVWDLPELEILDLAGNLLSGALPSEIRGLRKLQVLDLGFNKLVGEIPSSLLSCASLEVLNLSGNQLNGTIPLFMGGFPRLRGLYLSMNKLDGVIPDELGVNCTRTLEHLDLSGNLLVEAIPGSLGNCVGLRSLRLFSNMLENAIPSALGQLLNLQVLDVSRNTLSGSIPSELGNCAQLSVLVLSNLLNPLPVTGAYSDVSYSRANDDYNCFKGGIPSNITALPKLKILWVPRANLEGQLPNDWGVCGSLEMVNFGQNYFSGELAGTFGRCKNLRFLDLSSNKLTGELDVNLPVPCMTFFDASGNRLSGKIPRFVHVVCPTVPLEDLSNGDPEDLSLVYSSFFRYRSSVALSLPSFGLAGTVPIFHNFGGNNFTDPLPPLPVASERLVKRVVYAFLVDRNQLVGSLPGYLFDICRYLNGLIANFSSNKISGQIPVDIGMKCGSLKLLDVSRNEISGVIPQNVGDLENLAVLNMSINMLIGQIPESLAKLKYLKHLSLAGNNLTGVIPSGLSQLPSLEVLDLSTNSLSGKIPGSLANIRNLSVLLLDHNRLSGQIPSGFGNVTSLSHFNLSFNNLSGPLPTNANSTICNSVVGNPFLNSCPIHSLTVPPSDVRGQGGVPLQSAESSSDSASGKKSNSGFNSIEIATITSAAAIVSVFLALIFLFLYTRKCIPKHVVHGTGPREVTVFIDIGVPLTFDIVMRATGNFNASNCIGSGGFGATYKAEVAAGVLVAVKRLSVGRFQGVQQFHAEIKTLGRMRHPNLVKLIGFHASETEMFLIYNYLPGGNLENFIQERSKRPVDWWMLHKIALDVARALAYLHDQCVPRVLHRDVKPSNILLDNEYNAHLSDFGLARLLGTSETHATTGVAGTFGYVAPEYAMTCRVSDKADVYSYGVVLLELISDKKALDPSFSSYGNGFNIVAWACMLLRQGRAREVFAAGLWDIGPHDDLVEILHLAVMCTVDSLSIRPTMKHVVQRLKQLQPPTC